MDEIVNNITPSLLTVFEIEEDAPSNNEWPTWYEYKVDGKCEYCGTDKNECPKS